MTDAPEEKLKMLVAAVEAWARAEDTCSEAGMAVLAAFAAGEAMQEANEEKFCADVRLSEANLRLRLVASLFGARLINKKEGSANAAQP